MSDLFKTNEEKPIPIIEDKDYYAELVGEDKPYKDNSALSKAVVHKEAFIQKLQSELKDVRGLLDKRLSEDDTQARLQATLEQLTKLTERPVGTPSNEDLLREQDHPKPVSPEEIRKIAEDQFRNLERTRQRQENAAFVAKELRERFGGDHVTVLRDRAKALNLTEQDINEMAAERPMVLLELAGKPASKPQELGAPQSSVNTASFRPPVAGKTFKQYREEMRKNPRLALDPNFNLQMWKDGQKMGEAFYA